MRSVTVREPEWDDEERAKVLALLEFEGQKCPGCGGFIPDTTDTKNEGKFEGSPPYRCFRCDAVETKRKDYSEAKNPAALVVWPVTSKG